MKSDYSLLRVSKILFDNYDELYKRLLNIWDNPDMGWFGKKVQKNISHFRNLYSLEPKENFDKHFINIIKGS
jgi:hypothetical protein